MGEKIKTTQNNCTGSTLDEVFTNLKSSKDGLTHQEAKNRLEEYGFNELTKAKKPPQFMLFVDQLGK